MRSLSTEVEDSAVGRLNFISVMNVFDFRSLHPISMASDIGCFQRS